MHGSERPRAERQSAAELELGSDERKTGELDMMRNMLVALPMALGTQRDLSPV